MGVIHILDENVSNIIAAGEVVENYASLIKELFENSLDAKAKSIIIEISDNLNYIKITDDGVGMEKVDLYLSIERHATSKLQTKEDIYNLSSYGFRGEALASIASVSKMNISSKTADMKMGHKINTYAGNIVKSIDVAMKTGTVIEIRDLFYNTPARKKFLKKTNTELSLVKDIVSKLALSSFDVATSLIIDGKSILKTSGTGMDNTVYEVLGKNVFKNLKKFEYGYLGNEELYRASKNYIYTYVNNRYCKSNVIERAIIDAYYMKLMVHKYPFAIIFFDVDKSEVDVNVHPSKKLVKFSDDKIIYNIVKRSAEDFFYKNSRKDFVVENTTEEKNENEKIEPVNYETKVETQALFNVSELETESFEVVGQFFDTYVLVKNKDSLDFYDQHAMHERITYENLKEKYYNQVLAKKQLLIPEIMNIDLKLKDILFENIKIFNEFMFDIEPISENEVIIRSVPDFELRVSTKNIILAMLDSLLENNKLTDIREKVIISMACRSSIMAGQILTHNQMLDLVTKINEIKKFNCPHGRPVISKVLKTDLDKLAKRIL